MKYSFCCWFESLSYDFTRFLQNDIARGLHRLNVVVLKRHGQAVAEQSSVSQHPFLCFTQLPSYLRQRRTAYGIAPLDAYARIETIQNFSVECGM